MKKLVLSFAFFCNICQTQAQSSIYSDSTFHISYWFPEIPEKTSKPDKSTSADPEIPFTVYFNDDYSLFLKKLDHNITEDEFSKIKKSLKKSFKTEHYTILTEEKERHIKNVLNGVAWIYMSGGKTPYNEMHLFYFKDCIYIINANGADMSDYADNSGKWPKFFRKITLLN